MPDCLINGEERAALDVHDRGLHYGDGLFETVAVVNGRMPLWSRHMARLTEGARRLGIPVPAPAVLASEAQRLCGDASRAVLKILLTRGSGRGYRPPASVEPRRLLFRYSWPAGHGLHAGRAVTVRICNLRLGHNPALAGIKHLNRLEQVLARSEWDDDHIAEGLLLDETDHVIEGTQSNLFIVRDGRLLTPDLSRCGVAGVMRGLVMEEAPRLGIPCVETSLRLADVLESDEVFLCNSLAGIVPVRAIGEVAWPCHDLALRLAQHMKSLMGI
ncbi:MAG TPA: aminodeoxychorismate lyase [Gammaproteobacteria bacterium]|nr:aminodeoxychorismate lyase [Gammaproteobacteria bacterium]